MSTHISVAWVHHGRKYVPVARVQVYVFFQRSRSYVYTHTHTPSVRSTDGVRGWTGLRGTNHAQVYELKVGSLSTVNRGDREEYYLKVERLSPATHGEVLETPSGTKKPAGCEIDKVSTIHLLLSEWSASMFRSFPSVVRATVTHTHTPHPYRVQMR